MHWATLPPRRINIFMTSHYLHIAGPDTKFYTNYLITEIVPKFSLGTYMFLSAVGWGIPNMNSSIKEISNFFSETYSFPKITAFAIFRQTSDQSIHIDGIRRAALNIPVIGYEGTAMRWYKPISSTYILPQLSKLSYQKHEDMIEIDHVVGTNDWVIVKTDIPHCVTGSKFENPRFTISLIFEGNPSFSDLCALVGPLGVEPSTNGL